jgi:hypothetical protein
MIERSLSQPHHVPPDAPYDKAALDELKAIRRELAALRRLFDEFSGAFLNAKFPFGKPADRWRRP